METFFDRSGRATIRLYQGDWFVAYSEAVHLGWLVGNVVYDQRGRVVGWRMGARLYDLDGRLFATEFGGTYPGMAGIPGQPGRPGLGGIPGMPGFSNSWSQKTFKDVFGV